MKNKLIIAICLIIVSGCGDNKPVNNDYRNNQKVQLIYKTEHCRYYCVEKNGLGNCKVTICECDSGFQGDVSNSW